jgi:hypothetical protein
VIGEVAGSRQKRNSNKSPFAGLDLRFLTVQYTESGKEGPCRQAVPGVGTPIEDASRHIDAREATRFEPPPPRDGATRERRS